jgi:hypothetical protein
MLAVAEADSLDSLDNADALLICHDVDRGDKLEGKAYSRVIDSVAGRLHGYGWTTIQFALPYSVLTGGRAWGRPRSANRSYLRRTLVDRAGRVFGNTRLGRILQLYGSRQDLYAGVIRSSSPAVVMAIGCPPDLCRAAREEGVRIVEILHGLGYHEVPWGWMARHEEALPHAILSFDPVSTATFSSLEPRGVKVFQVTNPWFDQFIDPGQRRSLPSEWKERPRWIPDDLKVILVSLMWGYAGDHGPYEEYAGLLENGLFPEALLEAISNTRDTIHWLLRLHPVQARSPHILYRQQRAWLSRICERRANCEWVRPSETPMPVMLPYVDGHVTMSSMAAYDCAYFGVPTMLLCPTVRPGGIHQERFADLKELGLIRHGAWEEAAIGSWALASERAAPMSTGGASDDSDWRSFLGWAGARQR